MAKCLKVIFVIVAVLHSCGTSVSVPQNRAKTIRDIAIDKLGKIYRIYSDNTLEVQQRDGLPHYQYANNQWGPISSVDVTNPMKILLFYKNSSYIVLLDNTLSDLGFKSLTSLGYPDVTAVASSNDNHLWIYDAASYKLLKINIDGHIITSSVNMTEWNLHEMRPVHMVERDNKVYATDPNIGVLIFDNFGQYIRTIPVSGLTRVYPNPQIFIYQKDNTLMLYDLTLFESRVLALPDMPSGFHQIVPSRNGYTWVYPDTLITQ